MSAPMNNPGQAAPIEIAAGVATSLVLHGLIIVLALVASFAGGNEPESDEVLKVVFDEVELLAYGDIRNPDDLPRLSSAPELGEEEVLLDSEPTAAQVQADPAPHEEVVNLEAQRREEERARQRDEAEREAERERAAAERERRRQQALARTWGGDSGSGFGTEIPEGSPDGVVGGTVSDAALADMRATYQVRIRQELERVWEVPITISTDELDQLAGQVRVGVRLNENGYITAYEFLARSSNAQFDESIERALQRFQLDRGGRRLPLPDESSLRAEVLRNRLNLINWKVTRR